MDTRRLFLLLTAALAAACARVQPERADSDIDESTRATIAAAVDSATRAFRAAEAAHDAEATVAHLAPDFTMLLDGARVGYDSVAASTRRVLPSVVHFEPDWTDIQVRVLGPNAAVSSFLFRDSLVLEGGEVVMARGPTTLVWERRGPDWLIVFADADHYPFR